MKNYYEVLEISPNASEEIVERSYRTLTQKYNPSVYPPDMTEWAEIKLGEVSKAYTVLSDPLKRNEYNIQIGLVQAQPKKEKKEKKVKHTSIRSFVDILSNLKTSFKHMSNTLYKETKKGKKERKKDIIVLVMTVIVVVMLLYIFWNIPFIRSFLFLS